MEPDTQSYRALVAEKLADSLSGPLSEDAVTALIGNGTAPSSKSDFFHEVCWAYDYDLYDDDSGSRVNGPNGRLMLAGLYPLHDAGTIF